MIAIAGFEERVLSADELSKEAKKLDTDALQKLLDDGRPIVRANALRGLGVQGVVSERLPILLRDPESSVSAAAAETLRELGSDAEPLVSRVVATLADVSDETRPALLDALAGLVGDADETLIQALAQRSEGVYLLYTHLGEAGCPLLYKALEHPSLLVREGAIHALLRLAEDGVAIDLEKLAPANDDAMPEIRKIARRIHGLVNRPPDHAPSLELPEALASGVLDDDALEKEGKGLADAAIAGALRDGRDPVRANVARLAGIAGADLDAEGRQTLLTLLRDSNQKVRLAAIRSIGELADSFSPDAAVPQLLDALASADRADRDLLVDAVAAFGEDAVPSLVRALDASTDHVMQTVGRAWEAVAGPLTEALVSALGDPELPSRLHENAIVLLRRIAPDDEEAAEAIETYIEVNSLRPSRVAAPPLHQKPSTATEPAPLPVEGFDSEVLDAKVLKKLVGGKSPDVEVEYLEHALSDGRPCMRINAARALGMMGEKAHPVITSLGVRLLDDDPRVTRAVAEALGTLTHYPDYTVPMLGRAAVEGAHMARAAIFEAIDAFGDEGAEALLHEFEKFPLRTHAALMILAPRNPEQYVEKLASLLSHRRLHVRERAARVLVALGEDAKPAFDELFEALSVSAGGLRAIAIEALANIGKKNKKLVEKLLQFHTSHRAAVAYAAKLALRKFDVEFEEEEEEDEFGD